MVNGGRGKLQLQLEDMWDWAYCPIRVWWRRTGLARDVSELNRHRTGEKLVRESIFSAVRLYYEAARRLSLIHI